MSTVAFVSEDEFRATAPGLELSRYSTTTISGMLVKATAIAENYLDYSLAFESQKIEKVRGLVSADGDIWVFPSKIPIRALNAVSIVKGSFQAALTLSGGGRDFYDIIDDRKIVISASQISLQQVSIINYQALRSSTFFLSVNYDCGWNMNDRPQDIVEAVLLYARDLFAREQNSLGASEVSQGAVSIKYADVKGKSDFVKDAETILSKYVSVNA